ncbi:MAG: hypothetical protein GPOALKHO_001402 [Sodalis sp.]|nr:MAG: hypothetical protein GPOALKHO_001402 [Sodalis sp.]
MSNGQGFWRETIAATTSSSLSRITGLTPQRLQPAQFGAEALVRLRHGVVNQR